MYFVLYLTCQADPEELDDISSSNPRLIAEFTDLMKSVADIQAIDQEVGILLIGWRELLSTNEISAGLEYYHRKTKKAV